MFVCVRALQPKRLPLAYNRSKSCKIKWEKLLTFPLKMEHLLTFEHLFTLTT